MLSQGSGRHLLEYWEILLRRRWVAVLALATCGLIALIGSFLITPLYRSTVTLQIERQNPDILKMKDLGSVDYAWAAYTDYYQTQYKILGSDAVARKAAERLGLTRHPLFDPEQREPGLLARLRGLLPGAGPGRPQDPLDVAAAQLGAALEISPIRNSHLVQISWVSKDPDLAAQVANAVADAYIGFNVETSYTASDQASEFLVNQIGNLRREMAALEESLQSYGELKRIVSIDDTSNITLKALGDVAAKRTAAQTRLAEKEAAWMAASSTQAAALKEVLASELIARLKQEYAAVEADYVEKSRQFKDEWPGLQQLRSKLDQVEERLDTETESIARNVRLNAEAEYRQAKQELGNLDALVSRQEEAAQHLKRDAVEFASLQGEVQKKRETLAALMARQNEMALSTRLKDMDASSSNVRVVDRARPAAVPFRPRKALNLALGLMLGLALGVGLALFLDYLDSSIRTPAEIGRLVKLPVLAVVPRHGPVLTALPRVKRRDAAAGESVDLVSHRDRRATVSEAYRELRTAILLSSAGHPPRTIMVTSALPEEGKSATAINLAIVLSQLGRRVLIVDTDLRRPRLHKALGAANDRGISGWLSGLDTDLDALARPSGIDGLDIVTSGPVPPNPSELLDSPLFDEIGRRFAARGYDHVIFDSPPVLAVADPVIIASRVEAALLVTRAGRTPKESLRHAVDKFGKSGVRPIGVVLNDVDEQSRGYSAYGYYGRYLHAGDEARTGDSGESRRAG